MLPFGPVRKIESAGMDALILYFEADDITQANTLCRIWNQTILSSNFHWLRDTLPAYDSLLVQFDLAIVDSHQVYRDLYETAKRVVQTDTQCGQHHRLPVWYGATGANDLKQISEHTGLTEASIIQLHTQTEYRVFAVGFAPGFAYLGETPAALHCPRLATPRDAVPTGAVAIADRQTAVYPQTSPGGWHLLGLCPESMFIQGQAHQPRLKTGDTVSFYPITETQFKRLAQ